MTSLGIIQILFWAVALGLLTYLILRRVKIKKTENFEKRNN
ncbi:MULTISPECIES: hypothetical protein [Aquimarina]|nr:MULTISPECIES: hypothetical protein [Aquimarina]